MMMLCKLSSIGKGRQTHQQPDGNSKLVEVVTVVDIDDEDRVGNSLLQKLKLKFGHKTKL